MAPWVPLVGFSVRSAWHLTLTYFWQGTEWQDTDAAKQMEMFFQLRNAALSLLEQARMKKYGFTVSVCVFSLIASEGKFAAP